MPKTASLEDAKAELCAAILRVAEDGMAWSDLGAGELPESIAQAALTYANTRVRSYRRPGPAVTPVLASWLDSARLLATELGRPPSAGELARAAGKSNTAAFEAIRRLKAANMWF